MLRALLALSTAALAVFGLLGTWGSVLWFDVAKLHGQLGLVVGLTLALAALASSISAAVVALVTLPTRHTHARERIAGVTVASAAGAAWGLSCWSLLARWVSGPAVPRDPVLDARVLALPLWDGALSLGLFLVLVGAAVQRTRPSAHAGEVTRFARA